jgi:homoserine O-acetyltransferase
MPTRTARMTLPLLLAAACVRAVPSLPDFHDPLQLHLAATQAPAKFLAVLETTKGDVTIEVTRVSAPLGADRFYELARSGFFDGQRISRVVPGFIAQWGLHPDAGVIAAWKNATIPDDPPRVSNTKGTVAFAFGTPNGRATQVFVNLVDNTRLDAQGFAPFGRVIAGMDVVERWYGDYGEKSGGGIRAGLQGPIEREGAAWLDRHYPKLDRILRVRIESSR